MVVLTRDDIINGTRKTTEYESKILGQTVTIRALTDGEYSQIEALKKDIGKIQANVNLDKKGGIDLEGTASSATKDMMIDLDLKRQEEQTYKANCLTAAYGLSVDGTMRPEDLKHAPVGFAAEVTSEVLKLSKLTDPASLKDDVDSFREKE